MDFITYHLESSRIRDIDPANDCLMYVANRFELTEEQRYWLAFLYSTCYCGPTVYYMYNEFPDFENVNVGRLRRWWEANKSKCVFQTDRLRIKTSNQFVPTFQSYREWVGGMSQQERFHECGGYNSTFYEAGKIRNVGRFTLFIYLEMVSVLTSTWKHIPLNLDWKNANNCREAMEAHLGSRDYLLMDAEMDRLQKVFGALGCPHSNIYNIETTLCAYYKYLRGKRYVGYYIDRQLREINKMKENVRSGVAWRVMDEFRNETYTKYEELSNYWGLRNGEDLGNETNHSAAGLLAL